MAYHDQNGKRGADSHEIYTQERDGVCSKILGDNYSRAQMKVTADPSRKPNTTATVSKPTSQTTSTLSSTRSRPRKRSTSRNTNTPSNDHNSGLLSTINRTLPFHTHEPKPEPNLTPSTPNATNLNPNPNSNSLTSTQSTTNPLQSTQSQNQHQHQPHPSTSSTTSTTTPPASTSTAPTPTPTGAEAASKLADALDEFLSDVERKFKGISDEILARLDEMAERCDRLEGELLKREVVGGKEERGS